MRPTNEGYRFLIGTFLIGLAALNTGNNLLYLIFGLMLSILAISYAMLRINLSGLTMSIDMSREVYAGQSAALLITVRNSKRRFDSYSLRVALPKGLAGAGFIKHVPAAGQSSEHVEVVFRRRGVYRYGDFVITTSYPFIFFTRSIKVRMEGEVVVYPQLMEVDMAALSAVGRGQNMSLRTGRSEELLRIRQYREGDDTKSIHWKASARTGRLMVKEFAETEPRAVMIVLDDTGEFSLIAFEKAVSYAASLAVALAGQGYYVGLHTSGRTVKYGNERQHLVKILDELALVKESPSVGALPVDIAQDGMVVLVSKSLRSPLLAGGLETDMVIDASAL